MARLRNEMRNPLPDWALGAADDDWISSHQAAKLFGYRDGHSMMTCVRRGSFPLPERTEQKGASGKCFHYWWRLSTLKAEGKRRWREKKIERQKFLPPAEAARRIAELESEICILRARFVSTAEKENHDL